MEDQGKAAPELNASAKYATAAKIWTSHQSAIVFNISGIIKQREWHIHELQEVGSVMS